MIFQSINHKSKNFRSYFEQNVGHSPDYFVDKLSRPTWVEVSSSAIQHNFKQIKKLVERRVYPPPRAQETSGHDVKILAVVKADAYGHGAVNVAKILSNVEVGFPPTAVKVSPDYFGVASLEEGIELRTAGITIPILILGYTHPSHTQDLIRYSCDQTVYDFSQALMINKIANKLSKKIKIHLKIDTGMGRLGILPEEFEYYFYKIKSLGNLQIESIFTHFASADKDSSYTLWQFKRFLHLVESLEKKEGRKFLKHCSNSSAILNFPQMNLDMIRPGIMLYGLYSTKSFTSFPSHFSLKPALSLKSKIISIKELKKGSRVSYGGDYITKRKTKVAVIPIGYADGLSRHLSNKGEVLVQGRRCPIIGRVCMDFCIIDVTKIKKVKVGEEVVLIGKQGKEFISVEEVADKMNTINYEVVCLLGKRLPRIYK